jgi:16S rRNA (uracil1498-N3)-methyltransferase
MRLSRFFIDAPLSTGEHELPEAQAHYISRVLRMAEGDAVQLFDGSGHEFRGSLVEVGKKRVVVQIDEQFSGQVESPLLIHLGQGLSRGERMDWAIFSDRCEVRLKDERADKRLLHWRQVAISACEQCGRSRVPVIHPPVLLADWIKQTEAELKLVLHPVAEPLVSHARPATLAFLIGPEGGLSDGEVEQAKANAFHAARLGPRVLRTETAPVVALAVAQQLWGDF